ncbi:hypothetical protein [Aureivirga sp. CE67]|uniref:hypothetical protein n=1 Tax=Aureivirga sp. CE67 TaxID=1788983 RepID=UPI0018CA6CC9|nr:hypothetical protein [Aureivirga sp. CE67]
MKNKEDILQIRRRIPITMNDAVRLLGKTGSNILEAENEWKEEQVELLVQKINISKQEARRILEVSSFEIEKALSNCKSDIQKILESSNEPYEVIAKVWNYVHYLLPESHKSFNWIEKEGFDSLPGGLKDILVVWQWYSYYEYENTSVEQDTTSLIIDIIEHQLDLNEFAKSLRELEKISEEHYKKNPYSDDGFKKFLEERNKFVMSSQYVKLDAMIKQNKKTIMQRCYQILISNLAELDKFLKEKTPHKEL